MDTGTKLTQTKQILNLLKKRRYVTNIELNKICYRYSARIHELRSEGWDIEKDQIKKGVFRYWLVKDNEYGEVG